MTEERKFNVMHIAGLHGVYKASYAVAKAMMEQGHELELILRPLKSKLTRLEQKKLNAMCGDLSNQVEWHGQYLDKDDWRHMFVAAYRKEQRVAPGINGGFVVLGASSKKLTVAECAELIEMIYAFGAERNVKWSEF
jgi:hypothetical protein